MSPRWLMAIAMILVVATELLINGDFEQYHTGWTETTRAGVPVIQPAPSGITTHSGRYLAWLGGYHNADDQLYQNVTFPANLTSALLSFWYWSQSQETATGRDYFTLQLIDPTNGRHLVDAFYIESLPSTNAWRFASHTLTSDQLDAVRGRTVRVRFRVVTNATLLTSFFVDDVSLQVNGSVTPTATPTYGPTPTPTPTSSSGSWTNLNYTSFESGFPGAWQLSGSPTWGARNCRPYQGANSGWAIGSSALACGSNYPNNAEAWMTFGPFSLADATAAELTFKLWLNVENTYDVLCRAASINGSNFYGSCSSGNSGGWIDRVLDLSNVYTLGDLRGRSQVWIALFFDTDFSINYAEGAYVDNVLLRKCTAAACAGMNPGPGKNDTPELIEIPAEITIGEGIRLMTPKEIPSTD